MVSRKDLNTPPLAATEPVDQPVVETVVETVVEPVARPRLSAGEQSDLQLQGVTRHALSGAELFATDYPDLVDLDALSDQARANITAARKRQTR